jgi:hypothetical protein
MGKETGWAQPATIIGQPRIQKVAGFTYLYVEQAHVLETEVGNYVGSLTGQVASAYESLHGKAEKPPLQIMFINIPDEPKHYTMQVGYAVSAGTQATAGAKVRDIPPSLVAGVIAWGSIDSVWQSYGPLMDFMNQNHYRPLDVGWRELYTYWESPESNNNITWVQHAAEETDQ